jgi:hypothetical protein
VPRWPIWLVAALAGSGALAAGSLGDGPAGRGRLTLRSSAAAGWSARHIGVVVAGRRMFAFQYGHRLYMGPFHGKVRAVARREMPLGWTGRRLYTNSYPRRALLLRGPTGRLLEVLSPLPFRTDPVVADGSVYLILDGELMRARGAPAKKVVSLAAVGMSADSWLQAVGTLLELQDNRRLTVLRPDGSVFASTALPRRHGEPGTMSSSLVLDPHRHAVAFTVAYGESTDPRAHGRETLYLLRVGARTAAAVHTENVRFRVCERGAVVHWRGSWLLYENSEGNRALVHTAAPRPERRRRHSGGV